MQCEWTLKMGHYVKETRHRGRVFYDSTNMKCPEYAKQMRRKVISDPRGRVSRQWAVSANGLRFPFGAVKIFLNEVVEVTVVCTARVLKATKMSTLK